MTLGMLSGEASRADQDAAAPPAAAGSTPTLEQTREVLHNWIATQQIIAKERNEWQQGKEILVGRLELVKKEIASLEEKIHQAESSVAESARKRDELLAESEALKGTGE